MTELQVREQQQNLAMTSLSPQEVLSQIKQIQDLMNSAMKEGEHYGKIPGTDKPTLLKAGAEKLGFMFRLSPQFEIERVENLQNGHREYIVKCKLIHIPTGAIWGEGVGSCSTMESKYRWRKKKVDTGEPIPNDYKQNKGNYKAKGFVAGKDENGQWRWYKQERVENEDIADVYNTVLKMAKKRAHVDAMLTATAASDIFTQDVEEIVENIKHSKPNSDIQEAEIIEEKQEKPTDKKKELIDKIANAILEHVNGDKDFARSELMRLTTFVGLDGKEVKGTENLKDLESWSLKRLQATWGTIKREYGL